MNATRERVVVRVPCPSFHQEDRMTTLGRFLASTMLGASMMVPFTATPMHAAIAVRTAADAMDCILEPGVYVIKNSKDVLVGVLIVYPDCRTEIIPAT